MEMTNQLYAELEKQLQELEGEQLNIMCRSKRSVVLISQMITRLKEWLKTHAFADTAEEISFFKTVKPKFSALLVYHSEILRIETYRPLGKDKTIRKYLYKEIDKLKDYAAHNRDFYRYHLTGDTHLDDRYFVRASCQRAFEGHIVHPERDPDFSTSHCIILATFIANDLLQSYLYDELARVGTEECKQSILRKLSGLKLVWTGPKAALIELMYGLQTAGVFNESKADIRQIAAVFESVFNIELGDYYRTYQAIRIRKKNRTSFIDALKDSLVQRMDDTDERAFLNSR